MPQTSKNGCKTNKKKNGHAPAHQNSFGWTHNRNSKKTEKILKAPNSHVCRRCHDKIEWRKKYRKYKPRTQPGRCNLCQQRNVMAAYHTICTTCTTSDAAFKNLITQQEPNGSSTAMNQVNGDSAVDEVTQAATYVSIDENDGTDSESLSSNSKSTTWSTTNRPCHRVCAMCTKEPALPDKHEEEESVSDVIDNRRLKLRERRALERKLLKEQESAKESKRKEKQGDTDEDDNQDDDSQQDSDADDRLLDVENGESETEDDLIKAVGGKDKLLTGEAYQKMLLQQEQQGSTVQNGHGN